MQTTIDALAQQLKRIASVFTQRCRLERRQFTYHRASRTVRLTIAEILPDSSISANPRIQNEN